MRAGIVIVAALLSGCELLFAPGSTPEPADCDGAVGNDDDLDSVDDGCDNCPGVGNRDQAAMRDNDPVGDACDPHPDTPGDLIFWFESFHDQAVLERWDPGSGGWMFSESAAVLDETDLPGDQLRSLDIVPPTAEITVEVVERKTGREIDMAASGLFWNLDLATADAYQCAVGGPDLANDLYASLSYSIMGTGSGTVYSSQRFPAVTDQELALRASSVAAGADLRCSVRSEGGDSAVESLALPTLSGGRIALFAAHDVVRFERLTVYLFDP